jgi:hypothetical protein
MPVAFTAPVLTLVVASNVAVVIELAYNVPVDASIVYTFDAVIFVKKVLPDEIKPPDITPLTSSVPVETLVEYTLEDEMFAAVTFVVMSVPVVKDVCTAFVTVVFVPYKAPLLTLVVASNVPVVIELERMLEAFKEPLAYNVPVDASSVYTLDAVIVVNHTFWEVIKPAVIVPLTSSVPVEVFVEYTLEDEMFAAVTFVAMSVPVVKDVCTAFVTVVFVPYKAPLLTLVVAMSVPVVIELARIFDDVKFV